MRSSLQTASTWRGIAASPGAATGRAHIIRTERDLEAVEDGAILVARHGTPALLPALLRAGGVVCESGGLLNHAGVLARELGKPCVTGLPGIVEALRPGVQLHVDGSAGIVTVADAPAPLSPPGVPEGPNAGMVPVLQFGYFTPAFEYTGAGFDVVTALSIAALVSVPVAFAAGGPWPFAIAGNRLVVEAAALRATVDALAGRLESGALDFVALRRRYQEVSSWHGWAAFAREEPDAGRLCAAVRRYVALCRITWTASVAKEPLVARYRAFLVERLADIAPDEVERLFLDSLIMPDRSYILRTGLGGSAGSTWSRMSADGPHGADGTTARALARVARARQRAARTALLARLGFEDGARARHYQATLAALVDLTERKNTDLHQRGAALFGGEGRRRAIATLLDLDTGRMNGRRQVEALLEQMRAWGEGPAAMEPTAWECDCRAHGVAG